MSIRATLRIHGYSKFHYSSVTDIYIIHHLVRSVDKKTRANQKSSLSQYVGQTREKEDVSSILEDYEGKVEGHPIRTNRQTVNASKRQYFSENLDQMWKIYRNCDPDM
jgi:uncharacterized protein YeeX (DUF496 family)